MASARGYTVIEEFIDNDTSAFKTRGSSTDWARMLKALEGDTADVVIAVDLDRLLRDPRDLATIIDTGARILTVDGEIDLMTADGEFRASMLASLARFEVRRKSERQLRANADRASNGKPTPGRRRYGYEVDGRTPREAEAVHVRRMFEHVAGGGSIRSMALSLAAEGVDPAPGRSWSSGRVRYILKNPSYSGRVHRKGEALPSDVVVPIVPETLAEEVRAILADEARTTTPGPAPRYLASGIATCGVCGSLMFNLAKAYRCKDNSAHPNIRRERLDTRLRSEVARAVLTSGPELLVEKRVALAPLMDALTRNEAAATATAADRDEGLLSAPVARTRLIALRTEREDIEVQLAAARVERSSSSALADLARDLLGERTEWSMPEYAGLEAQIAERFGAFDIDRQRNTARALLDVTVFPGRDPRRVHVEHKVATALNPWDQIEDFDAE